MYDETPDVTGRVLVGSDGSEPALAAAQWAVDWARIQGQGVTLVRVVEPMPMPGRPSSVEVLPPEPDFTDVVAEAARGRLDAAVADIRSSAPDVDVAGALVIGHAAATLAELSGRAALTVLGATGASGLMGALLGGTVTAVLHHAHGNVVVVPATGGTPEGPVVVGLDVDDKAPRVLREAIAACRALDRPLLAVQAWDLTPIYAMDGAPVIMPEDPVVMEEAKQSLRELTASAVEAGISVEHLVKIGRAQDVLADLAPTASLLVIGSRGRGGFTGLLLGSVSRALTRHAKTPTLVVRS